MQKVLYLPSSNSTNNYAAKLLSDGESSGLTVIMTFNQNAGRGQRGNSWHSKAGKDLAFSAITHPKTPVNKGFCWSMWFSIWILQFLKNEYQIQAKIKWPNDIIVENKKLAGILIENQLQGKLISSCITGIGINVNSGEDNNVNAIALNKILGRELDIKVFAEKLSADFIDSYPNFQLIHEDSLRNIYHRQLYGYGKIQHFIHERLGEIWAKNKGVNPDGMLILEGDTPSTKNLLCDLKELQLIY